MIGLLRGQILHKQPPFLLLDVNGVGYEIEAPMSTFYNLPIDAGENEPVVLYTHLAIRDDAHILYGFAVETDRALFRSLLRISGVGGKMALGILSGMTADEFVLCIQAGDVSSLTRIPGVGKKTAERLIIEMRDRIEGLQPSSTSAVGTAGMAVASTPDADAVSALIALGYKPNDASKMVRGIDTKGLDTENIIKMALQATNQR